MLKALKDNYQLRWLLIWTGVIVAVIVVVHFFAKKSPASTSAGAPTIGSTPGADSAYSDQPTNTSITTTNNYYPSGTTAPAPPPPTGSPGGGTTPPPPPVTKPPTTKPPVTPSKQYVTVVPWTQVNTPWNSTLSGIAGHYGLSLSALLAFPENSRYRNNPNLIHPSDQVRVR